MSKPKDLLCAIMRRGKWESDVERGNVLAAAEPLREIGATGWKSSTATACGDCTERSSLSWSASDSKLSKALRHLQLRRVELNLSHTFFPK